MKKAIQGEQYGTSDMGKPIACTEEQLSRVYDVLYNAEKAGLKKDVIKKIFMCLPEDMKLEFNYSNWKYQES